MKFIYLIIFFSFLSSCKERDTSLVDASIFKIEMKNLNDKTVLSAPPMVFYHLEIKNISGRPSNQICFETASINSDHLELSELNFVPSQKSLVLEKRDTILLYLELLDKELSNEKIHQYLEDLESIKLKFIICSDISKVNIINAKKKPSHVLVIE